MRRSLFILLVGVSLFGVPLQESPRWVEGEEISPRLYKLLERIKNDDTILCKERISTRRLENLVAGYEFTHDPMLKRMLEEEANRIDEEYRVLKFRGCYDPKLFLDENYLVTKKNTLGSLKNPILQRLYRAYEKYKNIQRMGGWESIEVKDELYLKKGKAYDAIPLIRKRLAIEGYLSPEQNSSKYFDEELEKAIIEFQRHHSLKPDGIIGPLTLKALNEPVAQRLKKILINIERARWFVKNDNFFVFVDIPGFFLQVFKDGKPIFYSKVIVGRKSRPTPQMRNYISYAILNPFWRAPRTIIKEDILPHLRAGEFDTLYAEGIVASKDYEGKNLIAYEDVNWSRYKKGAVPFVFMQLPGDQNFLGRIKMMFPNRFDVYLHDTNERWLFKYSYRALSSGCVRVQKPLELFSVLLSEVCKATISKEDVHALLADNETKRVYLRPSIPIYLLYLTVYLDEKGLVSFFDDIYGIDKRMLAIDDLKKFDTIVISKRKEWQ